MIGYQVVGFKYVDGFQTLVMENMRKNDNPKTISVAVSKDPEGNGEGFLFITDASGDVSFKVEMAKLEFTLTNTL